MPRFVPTQRDLAIVRWVHEARVSTRDQVQRLLFTEGGRSRCQERLALLVRHRYLDRLPGRRLNTPDVYVVSRRSVNANRWLRTEAIAERRGRVSDAKVQHALDVAACRIEIVKACEAASMRLVCWSDEDLLEPMTARYGLIPDAYFQLARAAGEAERRSSFFLEVERSGKSQRYWREKLRRLGKFYYGGEFERLFGTRALRVLIVFSDELGLNPFRHVESLSELSLSLNVTFTRFAPLSVALDRHHLLTAPIWRRPGDQMLCSLYALERGGVDDDYAS